MPKPSVLGHLSLHVEAVGKYWAHSGASAAHWVKLYVYLSFIYK